MWCCSATGPRGRPDRDRRGRAQGGQPRPGVPERAGYGIDGPYGGKPAYAPSIGAASGVSLTDAPLGGARPETHQQLLSGARNLRAGGTVPAVQSDGLAALGVASGLLLGLYAKQRGST